MAIYAISDLHLSKAVPNKSMEMFGKDWENYEQRLDENWRKTVKENDTVLIPGDISWALDLNTAYEDFAYINSLPGNKVIIKGNHDYYFSTLTKVNKFLEENNFNTIKILNNNSFLVEDKNICGFRGWGNTEDDKVDDHKVFLRELVRLELSLSSIGEENKDKDIIVMTHFPPFRHEIKELFKKYNVKKCIYGHLHGEGHYMVREGVIDDVEYKMVSGDYTKFELIKLN
ncbi:MAG: metallophosphoesterase [Clostridia bacterium]|nr:metallophosphoesterase [Clostridia bacterium]